MMATIILAIQLSITIFNIKPPSLHFIGCVTALAGLVLATGVSIFGSVIGLYRGRCLI